MTELLDPCNIITENVCVLICTVNSTVAHKYGLRTVAQNAISPFPLFIRCSR